MMMRYKDFTREEVIEILIREEINYFWEQDREFYSKNDHYVLKTYLRDGFVGLANRSDEELKEEWENVFGEEDE